MSVFDKNNENHLGLLGEMMTDTKPYYWYSLGYAAVGAAVGWILSGGEPGGPFAGGIVGGVVSLIAIHFVKRGRALVTVEKILEANPEMVEELKENPA